MKIGITSDCSSCLEYAPFEHHIKITRTTIHFGEEELVDGIDINAEGFYKRLSTSEVIPSTSAPTPEQLISRAEEWRDAGCTDVIHFPISFGLSAYGQNLQALSDDYVDNVNYHVFNSATACIMEGYIAHYGEILANKGYDVDGVFENCQKMVDNCETYFLVDDLKYLVKNGRLNAVAGLIGQLMKIKPILAIKKNGLIETFEKVRTSSKALERMIEIVKEQTKDAKEVIYVVQHTNRSDDADALIERLKGEYSNAAKFVKSIVAPTVGAHIGCGVLSIGFIILDGLKEKEEILK